jgi:putative peptidoglycan lipid II flippase
VLRKVLTLSTGSLLGKLFGLAREILFAALFGTSAAADAYRAAMTATLAPVHLFTSEALNATFIPQFKSEQSNGNRSAWTLFNGIGITLLIISLFLGGLLYFLASPLVGLFFPGFTAMQASLSVQMLQIMSFGIPLYVLSALFISIEIAHEQFHLAALRPLVQNVGIIIAMAIAFIGQSPIWIAWGFTGTYIVFSLSGAAILIKKNILESGWYHNWKDHREVFSQFRTSLKPMLLFSALLQCNIILEKTIASLIGPGAVAAIDYAKMIPETAQLLLIVPLGMVSLSTMVTIGEDRVREH